MSSAPAPPLHAVVPHDASGSRIAIAAGGVGAPGDIRRGSPRTVASVRRVMGATVIAVSRSATHSMSKPNLEVIRLLRGLGVEGDAHLGVTVQHRSRVARDPSQPNLRQVHLVHSELHDRLRAAGFPIAAGRMGENVTTAGIDLLGLPVGARLRLGASAVVEVTGLRNPCRQLDGLFPGLMQATLARDDRGELVRLAGVMGIVLAGGDVRPGDEIVAEWPEPPYCALQPV